MKSFEEIARDLVAKWEHGDDAHRQWLREKAVPDIVEALKSADAERARLRALVDDFAGEAALCRAHKRHIMPSYIEKRVAALDEVPRATVRAEVHDAVMVDPSKMTAGALEQLYVDMQQVELRVAAAISMPASVPEHVRHDDVLYPHWLKVRTVLQGSEYDHTKTWGDTADAIIDALRAELTNDTVELTKRLHDGAAAAGWDVVLRAFVTMAFELGYTCVLERLESEATRDGWRLTHALLIELPPGQVSWRVTDAEAAALSFRCYVPFSDRHTWDGHTREEKYKRLEQFSRERRR